MIALLARVSEHQDTSWPDAIVLLGCLAMLAFVFWCLTR